MFDIPQYISQNTIPTKKGRKCVDGRYLSHTESSGMIARAGGDLGYVMALLSLLEKKNLEVGPDHCFHLIQTALQKMGEKFYMHTDHHADPESSSLNSNPSPLTPIIGCGHAAKPMNPDLAPKYHLLAEAAQELVAYAKQQAAKNPDTVKLVNLPGSHKEEAVLIITNTDTTVNSQDKEHMFFIYDQTRDMEFIEKLIHTLNMPDITIEEFKEILDLQTNATLHLLAKGLPIYEVNGNQVKQIGVVE